MYNQPDVDVAHKLLKEGFEAFLRKADKPTHKHKNDAWLIMLVLKLWEERAERRQDQPTDTVAELQAKIGHMRGIVRRLYEELTIEYPAGHWVLRRLASIIINDN